MHGLGRRMWLFGSEEDPQGRESPAGAEVSAVEVSFLLGGGVAWRPVLLQEQFQPGHAHSVFSPEQGSGNSCKHGSIVARLLCIVKSLRY